MGPDEGSGESLLARHEHERSSNLGRKRLAPETDSQKRPPGTSAARRRKVAIGGPLKFFPASVHGQAWMNADARNGWTDGLPRRPLGVDQTLNQIMAQPTARWYLGGDPRLLSRKSATVLRLLPPLRLRLRSSRNKVAGDATPHSRRSACTVNGSNGMARSIHTCGAARPWDANSLFPLYRGLQPRYQGVSNRQWNDGYQRCASRQGNGLRDG